MMRAINAARSDHLLAMNDAALSHVEAAVVTGTHCTDLAVHAHLLPLKSSTLAMSKRATANTGTNASLLIELALDDRVLCLVGRRLSKCKGGRCCECRHKHISK